MKKAWNFLIRIVFFLFIINNILSFPDALGGKADSNTGQKERSSHQYTLEKSSVLLPPGVPVGQYYRMIRPFPNWTLICDVNVKKQTKVCNVNQNVIDEHKKTVYSWSLVASETGEPFFIIRLSPSLKIGEAVSLDPNDGGLEIISRISTCDNKYCISYSPVGDRLKKSIFQEKIVRVTYYISGGKFCVYLPLSGLKAALKEI